MLGLGGFGAVSALCAIAPSIEVLVAGRALQGVFGALLTPASLAIIIATFDESERGKAIGTWTAYGSIAAVVGPLVGGQLVDALSWRWIFAINVPFVIVTLVLTSMMPAASTEGRGRRPDAIGATLAALGLAGPTFGLVRQPEVGWGSPQVLLPIILGFAVFAAFLLWERRARDPMLRSACSTRQLRRGATSNAVHVRRASDYVSSVLELSCSRSAGWSAPRQAGTWRRCRRRSSVGLCGASATRADRIGPGAG
jgi:MFS family permease